MKKRLLAMLLALVLVFSLLPSVVIAEGEEHVHCLCGANKTKGTTCAECHSEAVVWTPTDTMPANGTGDRYFYLTKAVKTTEVDYTGGHTAICLHGQQLSPTGARVAEVYSGSAVLTITDCDGDETKGTITGANHGSYGAVFRVSAGCTLNLYNGWITGNTSTNDGIICVNQGTSTAIGGTFNMYGGKISNNTMRRGAVYTELSPGTPDPVVRILGGEITGNTGTGKNSTAGGAGILAFSPVEIGGDAKIYGNDAASGPDDLYLRNDQEAKLIISADKPLNNGANVQYGLKNAEANTADLKVITGAPATWKNIWVTYEGQKVGYADGKFFVDNGPADTEEGEQPASDHIHCLCGAEKIEGSECAKCGTKAVQWQGITEMPSTNAPGYYYLKSDVTVAPFFTSNSEFAFCLCGHTMTSAAGKRMFDVSNGAVTTITDCSEEMGTITGATGATNNGSVMRTNAGSVINIYNGKITGNTGESEGLLYVDVGTTEIGGGQLNIYGGEISGNTCKRGAVFTALATNGKLPGSVKILGGVITGNTGTGTGSVGGGAGVYTFYPIEIGGNAQIYGNTAELAPADLYIRDDQGAKFMVSKDVPLTEGAKIAYGTKSGDDPEDLKLISGTPTAWDSAWVSYDGQKVGYADGKFFIDTGIVPSDHIHCMCGAEKIEGSECAKCGTKAVQWQGITEMPSTNAPGYYYLKSDVTVAPFFTSNSEFAFCLCGHTMTSAAGKRMFDVSNGAVTTITDCSEEMGTITGATGATNNGSVMRTNAGSVINIYNGKITGNTGESEGLLYVDVGTTEIGGGQLNIYGGEISGNTCKRGAVFTALATNGKLPGSVKILGGVITGNTGTGTGSVGGGAGVYTFYPIEIGGNAQIYGNTAELAPADLYIRDDQGAKFMVSKDVPLTEGAKIAYGTKSGDDPEDLKLISGTPTVWDSSWVTYDGQAVKYKDGKFFTAAELVISDHDHDGQKWISVTEETGLLPNKDGYYVLDGDVQLQKEIVLLSGNHVHLCLNGHTLTAAEGALHFDVRAGAKLTVCDCTAETSKNGKYTAGKITGGSGANGGAIRARAGSEVYLYDGIFCDNTTAGNGGVIYMDAASAEHPGAIFHMYGGMLRDNFGGYGGAVRLGAPTSAELAGPTFRMEGGVICDNESPNYGAALHAAGNATVELLGGVIENNKAEQGGGALSINGTTTVNLSGTIIRNNTATTWGGGVYIKTGAVMNMTGGEISGNSSKVGAGVLLESQDTTLNLSGGKISGNKAGAAGGAGIYASTNTVVNMSGGQIGENVSEAGGGGIALNRAFGNFTGGTVTGNKATGGAGISIQGGEVTLGKVIISKNVSSGSSGGVYVARSSEHTANVIIDGAQIINNTSKASGGGMFVYMNGNEVTMKSGKIAGNQAKDGGGVLVQRECTFTMEGGEISGNSVTSNGGGYYASIDSTFIMNGGVISGNYSEKNGGGVYILRAKFQLNSGSVSHNYAKGSAGGVMINGSKGSFNGTWVTNNESLAASGGGVMASSTTMKVDGVATRFPAIVSINAGRISQNKTPKAGAGLLLQAKDTVVDMYGGQISENVATKFAGGVYVGKDSMFNMHGGAVCYNVTENDVAGGIRHDGGGGNHTGGEIYGNTTTRSAGGVLVGGTGNKVTFKNVKIYDNTAKVGAGIVQQSKDCVVVMEDCEIYGNKASQEGAGIYVYTYVNLTAKNCHIHDNVAQVNGAGVWSWATSYVTLDGCTIENNQAVDGQGAGVWTRGDGFNIIGCTIRNNTSGGNGAGVCTGMMGSATPRRTPGLKIEDTLLENNTSGGQGGGLYQCSGSEGNLKNVKFIGNKATAEGGALWAVDEFTMHSVTATGNQSGGEGYAIYLADSDYDGHSHFNGLMKASGSMIVHDNQGGNLYLGEKTSMAIGEQGLSEDARIDVTLHSGLLTDWVWGAYNYEGSNLNYTITYGDRSITDPEIHTETEEPVEDPYQDGEPTEAPTEGEKEAPKGNAGLIAGIAAVVVVIAAAAVAIVAAAKKKKTAK